MSKTSNRKLRPLFQSRRRITLFVAIVLLTCGLHASRTTSASSIDTVVVTPDVTTAPLLSVNHQVIDDNQGDQLDTHIDCNLVSYTSVGNGLPTVKYFDFLTNTGGFVPHRERLRRTAGLHQPSDSSVGQEDTVVASRSANQFRKPDQTNLRLPVRQPVAAVVEGQNERNRS